MLYALQRYENGTKIKPVVLIDDYTNLLTVFRRNRYADDMLSFCKEWMPHQLNYYTEYFAITGEIDLENSAADRWADREFYNCQEDVFAESAFDHFNRRYMMLTPGRPIAAITDSMDLKRTWILQKTGKKSQRNTNIKE